MNDLIANSNAIYLIETNPEDNTTTAEAFYSTNIREETAGRIRTTSSKFLDILCEFTENCAAPVIKSTAKCLPTDTFDDVIGINIALCRADIKYNTSRIKEYKNYINLLSTLISDYENMINFHQTQIEKLSHRLDSLCNSST